MDPAELQAFRDVATNIPALITGLTRQQEISGENTQGIQILGRAVNTVQEELRELTVLLRQRLGSQPAPGSDPRHTGSGSASSSSPPPGSGSGRDGIRLPHPERYDGDLGKCKFFLTQCSIAFQLQPRFYPNDRAKIAYIISLLTGKALAWATGPHGMEPRCQFLFRSRRVCRRNEEGVRSPCLWPGSREEARHHTPGETFSGRVRCRLSHTGW